MTKDGPNPEAKLVSVGKVPTVFMFQPKRFEIVEGADMREWEQHLREEVGLRIPEGAEFASGTVSVSLCGTPERRDDCDQLSFEVEM